MERGCLSYVVADPETKLAAIVVPEAEMVEPMLGFDFKHYLKLAYVIDTHTHAEDGSKPELPHNPQRDPCGELL